MRKRPNTRREEQFEGERKDGKFKAAQEPFQDKTDDQTYHLFTKLRTSWALLKLPRTKVSF